MSKPQPSPEVLRSMLARRPALHHALGAAALLTGCLTGGLTGCLSPNGGETGTSDVMLGTDTGTTGDGMSDASTTHPMIMTTTEEPDTTDAPGSESSDTSNGTTDPQDTTTGVNPMCGNGSIEPGEECDAGADNSDLGLCTSTCHSAKCGDGYVQPGEACDLTINDGSYGGCAVDCTALGPYCGDGVVDDNEGIEACDGSEPWDASGGCLQNCQFAGSCKQIREGFPDDDTIVDGVYTIKPGNKAMLPVYCDMDADGGGYTFLKVALPDAATHDAKAAESKCAQYGMKLLALRTPSHVVAATIAAKSIQLDPVGGGTTKDTIDYLSILGIYPVTPGKSCVGKPLNSVDCPEWKAKAGPYFVTSTFNETQPGTSNCAGCSMYYIWSDTGKLETYEAYTAGGTGAKSAFYMCDVGDKHGA